MASPRVTVTWQGDLAKELTRRGAVRGLRRAAEFVLGESRQVVPIEEGTLSRSGATDVDETLLVATVSYDTPYAVRQHEELAWHHDAGRHAKYLELPLNNTRDQQNQIIAQEIRKELG